MAISTVKKAFTTKPSYASDPNAATLAEMCRKATAKDAYQPDATAKQLIASAINESRPGIQVPIPVTYDILRRRLNMENPHKQWLAVDLARHTLTQCGDRLRPYRADLLRDIARVAQKPNKKGNLSDQQNARKAALEFLQSVGQEGTQALQMVEAMQHASNVAAKGLTPPGVAPYGHPYQTSPMPGAMGPDFSPAQYPPRSGQSATNVPTLTGDVATDVPALVEAANSHCAFLRELLFVSPEDGGNGSMREGVGSDPLVSETKAEITQVKSMLGTQIDSMSAASLNTPESEQLMAKALSAFEELESCLDMARQADLVSPSGSRSLANQEEEPISPATVADTAEVGAPSTADKQGEEAGTSVARVDSGAPPEGDVPLAGASPSAPAGASDHDLLNFDSAPLQETVADSVPPQKHEPPADPFGMANVGGAPGSAPGPPGASPPNAGNFHDPFLGGPAPPGVAPGPSAQQSVPSNPFDQPTGGPPVPPESAPSAGSGGVPVHSPAASNPFGANAFGGASEGPHHLSIPPDQGGPSPGSGVSPHGQQQPAQFPGMPSPPQQHSQFPGMPPPNGQQQGSFMQMPPGAGGYSPHGQFGGPPTGQAQGQYGAPPTGQAHMMSPGGQPGYGPPPGGFPGYGQPPQGYGPPQGFNASPTGYYGQPSPGGGWQGQPQGFPPQGQQQGFGGPPTGYGAPGFPGGPPANPFQGGGPGPAPMGGFNSTATGFTPPGQVNPFAATMTGPPAWNPNANRDTFNDLLIEHNKITNPSAPMAAPMRNSRTDLPAA